MNESRPSGPLRALCAAASGLWWLLVAFWLVLVLAWAALHGWIVPRIGEMRPALEAQASRALGLPVRIGNITAHSDGLVPWFELRDVVLQDAQQREALRLARVVVALSPRSLWQLSFEQLVVDGPALEARRDAAGRLWVAGLAVSPGEGDERAADWFFRQREVVVRGGSLRWVDERSGAAPLVLTDVQLVVRNGTRRHALRLDATPPADWGQRFSLRGVFRQPLLSRNPGRWQDWSGQLHADLPAVDVSQLRQYTDLAEGVQGGRGALRAWADVDQGRVVGAAADVALRDVGVVLADGRPALALASVQGRVAGKRPAGGFELETRALQFDTADGRRWPGGNVALAWTEARGRQPAQGRLRADKLDIVALAQLATHLPLGTATLALLDAHAPQGLVEQVQARWQGPLDQPLAYEARGRASALAWSAVPATDGHARPALRNADIDFDFTERGGTARLAVARGAVELRGLLDEPVVPLDQLGAELQWQRQGERLSLSVANLRFANADVQGDGRVAWRTGDTARGRLPGVIDLQVNLSRADGARVWRYLPTGIPRSTREYVRDAVLSGQAVDGRIRVRGDLHDFPFADARTGEFHISARAQDTVYAFAPRRITRGTGQWPVLGRLSGQLVFEGNSMTIRNARGGFVGAPGLQVQAEASIPDLRTSTVVVNGEVRGPLAESLAVFNATPVAQDLGQPLAGAVASGPAELRLRLALPLSNIDRSRVQGSVTLAGNDVQVTPETPPMTRARGVVAFSERGFMLSGIQARGLGGEVRLEGGTRVGQAPNEPATVLRLQGSATAEGLRQAPELGLVSRLARRATGGASYSATLGLREGAVDIVVASNLQGLALNLPAPLSKPAEASLPLRFEIARDPVARQDQIALELGRVASVSYVRDVSGAEPQVLRGAIAMGLGPGEAAPLPEQGVRANLNFAQLNLDAWEEVLTTAAGGPARLSPLRAEAGTGDGYLPTAIAIRARELTAEGRTLHNLVVGGTRDGLVWRGNVDATELNGYLEFRQSTGGVPGRLYARLARLSIAAGAAGEVESLLDQQPTSIPALDIVVDDFELRGRKLGRLEIDALNRGAAGAGTSVPEWRLNRLSLGLPEGQFSASGNWVPVAAQATRSLLRPPERRRTVMNFRLDVQDAGQLLQRLGLPGVVRRGRGKLEGQVAWLGSPLALDYPTMNGQFNVNIENGQFLKAEPGAARLLSVLSLQSLPRRLALDFRDVFSEGFSFDFVRGDVGIVQGVAGTNNLQMKGVNAAVLMEGKADIARETQDLRVIVVPEINAGTASLVAAAINPAIGLGTFIAQLFLREPLMRAATQEFQIDGTWADPRIARVPRRPPPAGGQAEAARPGQAPGAN